jgi:hypothetical protein
VCILLSGGEQALGLLQDRSGEPLTLRPRQSRKTQGTPFLGHGCGGIRPGQAFGAAQTAEQFGKLGQRFARSASGSRVGMASVVAAEVNRSVWLGANRCIAAE